ncbi:MAG: hypothetical protein IKQ75_02645 [Bacteroidales bacterium]|nr:hypothetical protein [Bacteroidales bacterium]
MRDPERHLLVVVAFLMGLCVTVAACRHRDVPTPKPVGYFRIDLPERQYQHTDTTLPFTFDQSDQSVLSIRNQKDGSCWIDVSYPALNAAFKLTCIPVPKADSLRNLMIREEKMVKFHYQKADDVEFSVIQDPEARLWGRFYDIEGKEVATPLIFWMTDSAHYFLRGTLYFNFTPNNDSLQPVIDYLREDFMQFTNTFKWK